jgi:hypothetical protein
MPSKDFFETFAAEWIAAWNSHDMDRILSLYEDDFEFSSPFLAGFIPESGGRLKGKAAVGGYWSKALAARPELRFEPVTVFKGLNSVVIHYQGLSGRLCAEFFVFGVDGKVVESHAHEA